MVNSETDDSSTGPTPGEILRAARESQDISRREMADRLNWRHDFIDAVEENRFEVLRGAAFVSGYLRTYARLLGVGEDEILAALKAMNASVSDEEPRRVETRLPQVQKHGFAVPVGIAAAVLLIAGMWWLGTTEDEAAPAADRGVSPSTEVDAPEIASVPAVVADTAADVEIEAGIGAEVVQQVAQQVEAPPVAIEGDTRVSEAGALEVTESPVVTEAIAVAEAPAPVPERVEPETAEPGRSPVEQARGEGDDTLAFRFNGDCWLEVRDSIGEIIYADLRRSGDVLSVSGAAPFRILVGDASAVQLSFRDESVDIPVRPGRTTARFTVGEP